MVWKREEIGKKDSSKNERTKLRLLHNLPKVGRLPLASSCFLVPRSSILTQNDATSFIFFTNSSAAGVFEICD